jgi:hypothetical protein
MNKESLDYIQNALATNNPFTLSLDSMTRLMATKLTSQQLETMWIELVKHEDLF